MRIIIFANGLLENPTATIQPWLAPDTLVAAADGGARHATAAGLIPHTVIGDMDSLTPSECAWLEAAGTCLLRFPPEKNETDLELALQWAARQNAAEIVILGALGGRPDQELANLMLLTLPELTERRVLIVAPPWEIQLLRGGTTTLISGTPGDLLSLVPLGGAARDISTTGLAYPLTHETLSLGPARGISNVFTTPQATIHFTEGLLWCFHALKN